MSKLTLEISCCSAGDAQAAESAGADRVELCSAPFLGGLTPSAGTILECRARVHSPFVVMVRPRRGGFCFSDAEFAAMERDAGFALENGASGIVTGLLRADGHIDVRRCGQLKRIAGTKEAVFHRAFDVVPDPFRALDELIDLGFTRVLTSGQKPTALEGADLIRRLIERAAGRIEILPGGGIRPHNAREVIGRTGCTQVHLSAMRPREDSSPVDLKFGSPAAPPENEHEVLDGELVSQMAEVLREIGSAKR